MAATDSPEKTTTREAERPPTAVTPRHDAPATTEKSGKATVALVLGILSIPAAIFPILGLPIALVGLVLALVARGEIKRRQMSNAGTAKAALILCIIGLMLTVASMIGGVIIATS